MVHTVYLNNHILFYFINRNVSVMIAMKKIVKGTILSVVEKFKVKRSFFVNNLPGNDKINPVVDRRSSTFITCCSDSKDKRMKLLTNRYNLILLYLLKLKKLT